MNIRTGGMNCVSRCWGIQKLRSGLSLLAHWSVRSDPLRRRRPWGRPTEGLSGFCSCKNQRKENKKLHPSHRLRGEIESGGNATRRRRRLDEKGSKSSPAAFPSPLPGIAHPKPKYGHQNDGDGNSSAWGKKTQLFDALMRRFVHAPPCRGKENNRTTILDSEEMSNYSFFTPFSANTLPMAVIFC